MNDECCANCKFCFMLKNWQQILKDFELSSVCCYFPINGRIEEKDKQPKYEHFAMVIDNPQTGLCECFIKR